MSAGLLHPLAPDALAGHLVERGVLPASAVVDAGLRVEERGGRNVACLLRPGVGGALFAKQGCEPPSLVVEEAHVLRVLGDGALADLAPRVVHLDAERLLLVVEGMPGATLAERGPEAPAMVALGCALARVHGHGTMGRRAPMPAALRLQAPRVDDVAGMSSAALALVREIQASRPLLALLDPLRASWRARALIHGDVRFANVLIRPAPAPPVALVDWELGGDGDPVWDVACVIADALAHPAASAPPGADAADGVRAFLAAYRDGGGEQRPTDAARLAGARLLQIAVESAQEEAEISEGTRRLARLGALALADPAALLRELWWPGGGPA